MNQLQPDQVEVIIAQVNAEEELRVEEAELDEMWSFVHSKQNPRWLWHAIDRKSGQVLTYVFGRREVCGAESSVPRASRKDNVILKLKELLKPFGIKRYCTDGWGIYDRHLPAELHKVGKIKTQRIERKHLGLRT